MSGKIEMKAKVNRRSNAASRTIAEEREAVLIILGKNYRVELVDYEKGGVGILVPLFCAKKMAKGDKVRLNYFLIRQKISFEFVVCSVTADSRIGMRYADGLMLHPKDRVLKWQRKE